MRRLLGPVAGLLILCSATPAAASPVATSDAQYAVQGRVFTDPLGGCQLIGVSPCDPAAQGNVPATSFIGINEFRDGLAYMNSKPEWARYMDVLILDGRDGPGSATKAEVTADPRVMFPGNTLPPEFSPRPANVSAGLPRTGIDREKSDLTIVRVTDETVPDAGKKRYTLSLSIHGIERAGIEGGTRAMEDMVTAVTTGRLQDPILPKVVRDGAPTFAQALQKSIVYFTYPNPDGWRRGTYDTGALGSTFQRYNGNGVDPNRDYTDIGYNYRGYSGGSEPETRAFKGFYRDVLGTGATFQAGDDLHGQPFADALSYTLMPHGQHDFAKDTRIRETAKLINRSQYETTKWDPRIIPNVEVSEPQATCGDSPVGAVCPQIYAQTWGSVYDTINYTTTGTLGDWFDSTIGLDADGIDNEMSFSHLDKQIRFDQRDEQLHVAGNKSIIFAHLADIIAPVTGEFDAPGAMGYVPNKRLTRAESANQPAPPPNTVAQATLTGTANPDLAVNGAAVYPFEVKRTVPSGGQPGIFNGGMNVQATGGNVQGVGSGSVKLFVQCRFCDEHVGALSDEFEDWITVAEDYNQSPVYAQAGAIASVNLPDAQYTDTDGKVKPVEWRAVVSTSPLGVANLPSLGPVGIEVEFSQDAATDDGNNCQGTVCDEAPVLKAYDVANTDFFNDLNRYFPDPADRFQAVDPRKVIEGTQSLTGLHTLVLADELLPGFNAPDTTGTGPPTADVNLASKGDPKLPAQGPDGCSTAANMADYFDFTINPVDGNRSLTAAITWTDNSPVAADYDLFLLRKAASGQYSEEVASGVTSDAGAERFTFDAPPPGDYRVAVSYCLFNPITGPPAYTGKVTFEAAPAPAPGGSTGDYTVAEKNAWVDKLEAFANGGGNLVLTDKAVRGLSELVPAIGASKINRQTVYVGQMAVTRCNGYTATGTCAAEVRTLDDPLMRNVNQPGSRFNTGFRRQLYEPTPLGYAIQDAGGADQSNARQFDVDAKTFTDAGGRVAATSANAGERDAIPVTNRVTVGEIPMGAGRIRIAGALLPQPSNQFDHPLGVTPYAVTYTGYILACNLFGATCSVKAVPQTAGPGVTPTPTVGPGVTPTPTPGPGGNGNGNNGGGGNGNGNGSGGGAKSCLSNSGFRFTRVTPAGDGLRIAFQRKVSRPVKVGIYQSSEGSAVIRNRKVKVFSGQTKSFTWDGAGGTDGLYVVRLKIKGRRGKTDIRTHTLSRDGGVFTKRKTHARRGSCKLLKEFRLIQPAFGGTSEAPLKIRFKVAKRAKVKLVVARRGGGVVKSFRAKRYAANRRVSISLPSAALATGDYIVRLTAKRGGRTVRASLVSRRI